MAEEAFREARQHNYFRVVVHAITAAPARTQEALEGISKLLKELEQKYLDRATPDLEPDELAQFQDLMQHHVFRIKTDALVAASGRPEIQKVVQPEVFVKDPKGKVLK